MLCGLGPGPSRTGDQLDLGVASRPHGLLSRPLDQDLGTAPRVIRFVDGPHRCGPSDLEALTSIVWTVGETSNRIGIRLQVPSGLCAHTRAVESTGMVTGAIQIPPDGDPIILMPDHATVGGYPVIGCVITADLAKLGQLRPGDHLTFSLVDGRTARGEYRRWQRIQAGSVSGWFPTKAGT